MGPREAVEIAQRALNFLGHGTYAEDGFMGPMTLSGIDYWTKVDPPPGSFSRPEWFSVYALCGDCPNKKRLHLRARVDEEDSGLHHLKGKRLWTKRNILRRHR